MDILSSNLAQIAVSLVAAAGALVSAMVALLVANRDRVNKSRYDRDDQSAELSLMRATYEDRLAELTQRLTSTQERWAEVNHLLLDAQRSQPSLTTTTKQGTTKSSNSFLTSLGIDRADVPADPKFVFVLTPFSKAEKGVYEAIRHACNQLGLRAGRGDEEFVDGPILPHIVREILRAKMVIGNVSARNPNVFYELGIAQALGKPTVLVSRGSVASLPFDLRSRRVVFFETEEQLEKDLMMELARWMVDAPYDNATRDEF